MPIAENAAGCARKSSGKRSTFSYRRAACYRIRYQHEFRRADCGLGAATRSRAAGHPPGTREMESHPNEQPSVDRGYIARLLRIERDLRIAKRDFRRTITALALFALLSMAIVYTLASKGSYIQGVLDGQGHGKTTSPGP